MIDVEQDDRDGATVLDGLLPQPGEIFIHDATILGPRQRVVLRKIRDDVAFKK